MRYVLSLFGVIAGIVLLLVSAAMNWRFGFSLGKTELDAQIYGAASAAADGLKALLPFFVLWAMRQKSFVQVIAGVLLWCVCSAYSLTSSLGFAAINRADTMGAREAQATQYGDLRTELKRIREKLSWVPQHRSVGEIEADLKSVMARPVKGRRNRTLGTVGHLTKQCAKVDWRTQAACNEVLNLRKELAVAQQAATLEKQIADVKAQLIPISTQSQSVVNGGADPQAVMLSKLTGVDKSVVQIGLIILVALLVELGSGLGLFVAFAHIKPKDPPSSEREFNKEITVYEPNHELKILAPPVSNPALLPGGDLVEFSKSWVEPEEGVSVTATELYDHYRAWCEVMDRDPMALPVFGRNFGKLGTEKAKIGGRIRYLGISLIRPELPAEQVDDDIVSLVPKKSA